MKLPRVGENLKGFTISDDLVGSVQVTLSPSDIATFVETKHFGMLKWYLYSIPLIIFYQLEPDDGSALSIRGPESVFGPVLIFGYDGSPRSLTDFELQCMKSHVTMERYGDDYTIILNDISKNVIKGGLSIDVQSIVC